MLGGLPRPRRVNDLILACRYFSEVVRLHEKWALEDPALWGPRWLERDLHRIEQAKQNAEIDAALRRVYGDPPASSPGPPSAL